MYGSKTYRFISKETRMQGTKTDRLRKQGIRSKGQDVGNIFQKLKQVQFPLSNTRRYSRCITAWVTENLHQHNADNNYKEVGNKDVVVKDIMGQGGRMLGCRTHQLHVRLLSCVL